MPADNQQPEENKPKLTAKQQKFVDSYCQHLNASRAAREAGYGMLRPDQIGYENLRKPEIAESIKQALNGQSMTIEEGVRRLTDWGRGTLEPFLDEVGFISLTADTALNNAGLLRKIKQTKRVITNPKTGEHIADIISTEIEIHDPKDAVSKLLEVHGKIKGSGDTTNITIFQLPDNGR